MPKLKREFFDGKSRFKPHQSSNYHDGRYHVDEWRIDRYFGKDLNVSQRFCDFFGSRKEALKLCAALESIPRLVMKRKVDLGVLRMFEKRQETMRDSIEKTFADLRTSEAELKEKTLVVDALMIELRSQKVEMQRAFDQAAKIATEVDAGRVRRIDELEAQVAALQSTNRGLSIDNRELDRRSVDAEALVGRIVIKRDRRSR